MLCFFKGHSGKAVKKLGLRCFHQRFSGLPALRGSQISRLLRLRQLSSCIVCSHADANARKRSDSALKIEFHSLELVDRRVTDSNLIRSSFRCILHFTPSSLVQRKVLSVFANSSNHFPAAGHSFLADLHFLKS